VSVFLYRLGQGLCLPLHLLFRLRCAGMEHLPRKGACLLASNHISHFDPVLISMPAARDIDYMASAEFFVGGFSRAVMQALNAFPIDRSRRDLSAVKAAIERLQAGKLVGIFVEGGIRQGDRSVLNGAPIGEGTTALAQAQGVPIVPVVILGSDQLYQWRAWFRRPRIFIRFGVPIQPQPEESRRELALRLAAAMRTIFAEMKADEGVEEWELPQSAQERWAVKGES